MKLNDIKEITGTITLKTGLHIGSGDAEMKIGGTDNSVIKHPFTQEPYIPGSSLKGKVRSLLEMKSGLMAATKGKPVKLDDVNEFEDEAEKEACKKLLKLFGSGASSKDELEKLAIEIGPTRASFADSHLDEKWKIEATKEHRPLFEIKSENSIDRIKGTAENPRFTERVPAETVFRFSISLKKLAGDDDMENFLLEGLKLLEMDVLGGNGSRGYGKISFLFDCTDTQKKFSEIKNIFQ